MHAPFFLFGIAQQAQGLSPWVWVLIVLILIVLVLWWLGREERRGGGDVPHSSETPREPDQIAVVPAPSSPAAIAAAMQAADPDASLVERTVLDVPQGVAEELGLPAEPQPALKTTAPDAADLGIVPPPGAQDEVIPPSTGELDMLSRTSDDEAGFAARAGEDLSISDAAEAEITQDDTTEVKPFEFAPVGAPPVVPVEVPVDGDVEEPIVPPLEQKLEDLELIEGIGPKIASVLREAGIHTFNELAVADVAELREILRTAGLRLADPSSWPQQAQLAAEGKWEEFETLTSRLRGGRSVG